MYSAEFSKICAYKAKNRDIKNARIGANCKKKFSLHHKMMIYSIYS